MMARNGEKIIVSTIFLVIIIIICFSSVSAYDYYDDIEKARREAEAISMAAMIVGFLFAVVISIFIYGDAKRYKGTNAGLWAIVGFFLSFIGLILWLIVRGSKEKKDKGVTDIRQSEKVTQINTCPSCNNKIEVDWEVCPFCGAELKIMCPTCGKRIEREWKTCPYCGTNLKEICPSCKKEIEPTWEVCPFCGEHLK